MMIKFFEAYTLSLRSNNERKTHQVTQNVRTSITDSEASGSECESGDY